MELLLPVSTTYVCRGRDSNTQPPACAANALTHCATSVTFLISTEIAVSHADILNSCCCLYYNYRIRITVDCLTTSTYKCIALQFLAHLSKNPKWVFLIACISLSARLSANFSHFHFFSRTTGPVEIKLA